ncbi:hypothetical protein TNCV_3306841 [Trichonephila clavipes]|nr:hypothetical protein TNCV_3306841 [Trichonephila clavipes]
MNIQLKRSRKEVMGYKRSINLGSGGPEKERRKMRKELGDKRKLTPSYNSMNHYRKKDRREEATMSGKSTTVWSRGRKDQQYSPYSMDQGRSSGQNSSRRGAQQQQRQEMRGGSESLKVLVGDVNYRTR